MTKEEFFAFRAAFSKKFENDLLSLERECARSNNKVNIGDVLSDGKKSIIVDKYILRRAPRYGNGYAPYYDYYGRLLTNGGKPRKDGTSVCISAEYIKTINGKEVNDETK